ncbi:MAG: hypothetical protein AUK43_05265 [Oscillatoriales cyanobacterium CG2_30_40_61]|nr:MAG: hypothetical protein AUK43_05265 [Oscillatoriales cyanobacterium CG2_30_40_61]
MIKSGYTVYLTKNLESKFPYSQYLELTQMHPIAINRLALSPSHHGKAPIQMWHTAKKPQKHITKAQIVLIQALIY